MGYLRWHMSGHWYSRFPCDCLCEAQGRTCEAPCWQTQVRVTIRSHKCEDCPQTQTVSQLPDSCTLQLGRVAGTCQPPAAQGVYPQQRRRGFPGFQSDRNRWIRRYPTLERQCTFHVWSYALAMRASFWKRYNLQTAHDEWEGNECIRQFGGSNRLALLASNRAVLQGSVSAWTLMIPVRIFQFATLISECSTLNPKVEQEFP